VGQHDRRSACDPIRMTGSGSCVEDLPGTHFLKASVRHRWRSYISSIEHYPGRSGNASGNIDGENVCPTVNPTR
jgi:hypothetical protein